MKFLNILLICTIPFIVWAIGNDKKTIEIKVDGICEMCKERIEDATYKLKGVRYANWVVESKTLTVTYKNNKITQEEIEQAIADIGHDTENITASDSAYQNIHKCCRYREMEDH